jgi:hypothetical protein
MYWFLIVVVIQHGTKESFSTRYDTFKECKAAKIEALKHDNSLTKVTAKCVKLKVEKE